MRNFPWVIGAFLVLLIAGGIGFWLGVGAAPAQVVAPVAGTPVVYAGGWHGFGFGFPFFEVFFFVLFVLILFGIVRRAVWGRGGGSRHYGPGFGAGRGFDRRWDGDVPPMADDMLQRWHRKAHGEPEPDANQRT
jgi:hypothetical protein